MKKIFRILTLICMPLMIMGILITAIGLEGQPTKFWVGFSFLCIVFLIVSCALVTFICMDNNWFKSKEELDKAITQYYDAKDGYWNATRKFVNEYLKNNK